MEKMGEDNEKILPQFAYWHARTVNSRKRRGKLSIFSLFESVLSLSQKVYILRQGRIHKEFVGFVRITPLFRKLHCFFETEVKKLDFGKVKEALSSAGWQQMFFRALLEQYQQELEENGLAQCEADYLIGWERLSGVLTSEQMELHEELEGYCEEQTLIAFEISLERGFYAGFRNFFQRGTEPLTFEQFVLDKLLAVPEMKQFPDYHDARMKVNELETDLANQLDPFSREHLTSITYAWEERTMAMLRYGFALGYQKAVDAIGQVEPESAGRVTQAWWKVKRETLQF